MLARFGRIIIEDLKMIRAGKATEKCQQQVVSNVSCIRASYLIFDNDVFKGGASSKEKELPRGPGVGATEDSPIAGLNFLRGLRKGVVHQYNAMQNWALLSKTREGLLRGLDLVSPRRGIGKRGGETPRSSSDDASEGKAKAKEVLGAGGKHLMYASNSLCRLRLSISCRRRRPSRRF